MHGALNSQGLEADAFPAGIFWASAATEGEFLFNTLHDAENSVGFVAGRCDCGCLQYAQFRGSRSSCQCPGGTLASAFSCTDIPIRDLFASSLIHPIHACAHSRLDLFGVGSGVVGVGVACPCLLSPFCGSGVVGDVDDACLDGSNSLIQGSCICMCMFGCTAKFTPGSWSLSPGRNKVFEYWYRG